jgi:hypothetical protein
MFRKLRVTVFSSTIICIFALVFILSAIPASMVVGTEVLDALTHGVDHDSVIDAYWWTLYSCCLMLVLSIILGIWNKMHKYAQRPLVVVSELRYEKLWWITISISLCLTLWMFAKCGFRIPIVESINIGYAEAMILRKSYEILINQNVFTLQLYGLAGLNLAIALTGINRHRRLYIGASICNILLICSFSLAKSPIANVFLIMILFYSLVRPIVINLSKLIIIPLTAVCLLLPGYWVSGITENVGKNPLLLITERIVVGQWAALPYYFKQFDDAQMSYSSVLPPYVKRLLDDDTDNMKMLEQPPSRYVMRAIIGDAGVDEGGAGVATAFFIGEAFALGGYSLVIVGCFLVVVELWLLSKAYLHFRKTVVSSYIYAFMLFKFCMGLVSGISAFVLSGFTIVLYFIVIYAMAVSTCNQRHWFSMSKVNQ